MLKVQKKLLRHTNDRSSVLNIKQEILLSLHVDQHEETKFKIFGKILVLFCAMTVIHGILWFSYSIH
jgi:heme/copper-type cytochrome/quinol oxidase subunit 4